MKIKKINIYNYKCFKGKFSMELNDGLNIIVGNNEAGKSTILEAIHLGLSGIINGRYLRNEISQYLFNNEIVQEYLDELEGGNSPDLPYVLIEIFFKGEDAPILQGNGNKDKEDAPGVSLKIEFDSDNFSGEYEKLIEAGNLSTIPIEYYKITWKSFARHSITSFSIPVKSVLIDSSSYRFHNGSDIYISRIVKGNLDNKQKAGISQAYRELKETFKENESVIAINDEIKGATSISDKEVSISVDLSTKDAWETTLMTYLDKVPFHQIGKGEQSIIKTNLALAHKKSEEANLILLEEPENHLSHSKLNEFIENITKSCADKQIVITTHSSYVANKLGLEHIILLNNLKHTKLSDLSPETYNFFKKLPGYATLRLILCEKAILVEGDSDELIVQKAFMAKNEGKLPIQRGVDVISVKLTFLRFLEIAEKVSKKVAVVTDNDGNYKNNIKKKYREYKKSENIKIFADKRKKLNTLEPQFLDANKEQWEVLLTALKIDAEKYDTEKKVLKYMKSNKTKWALNVFETEEDVKFPKYIKKVVKWCNEE